MDPDSKLAPANTETVASDVVPKKKRGRPPKPPLDPDAPEIVELVDRLNVEHFVIKNYGSKCRIGSLHADPVFPKCEKLLAQPPYDFYQNHQNQPVHVSGTLLKGETAATIWMKHSRRRQYEQVVFEPGQPREIDAGGRDKRYNLWRGLAYPAVKGDCSLYLDHVRNNICAGDETKYNYTIKWMAYAVRNPGEQGHVAIVVQGLKGVGKNVFAEGFAALFGQHGIVVSDQGRVLRNFNAHLRDKCVLVADEAFYAGDRRHQGQLKTLITGDTLQIEAKGVDAVTVRNLLHVIIISNDPHIVDATDDERRYLVMRCGREKIQNTTYFAAIVNQLEHGGYEALHYHLLHEVDLTGFEVRSAPHTAELYEQMAYSLRSVDNAWFECLYNGAIPACVNDDGTAWLSGTVFAEWAKKQSNTRWHRISSRAVAMLLGETVKGHQSGMGWQQKQREEARHRFWDVPTLSQCRELWSKLRFKTEWPNDGNAWVDNRDDEEPGVRSR